MRNAEAGSVYFLAGLETPRDGMPLVVIPTPKPAELLASAEQMLGKRPSTVEAIINDVGLIVGAAGQINRIKSSAPSKNNTLLMPLSDGNRLDHTAVLVVPDQMRDLLGNVWPDQPPRGLPIPVSPKELVESVRRIVLTLRTPPEPLVRLTIDAASDQAASQMAAHLTTLRGMLGDMLSEVTIKRDGNHITVHAGAEVFSSIRSVTLGARANAREAKLVRTLKQLGLAFHNYSDAEKHLPPRCFVDPNGRPLHSWMVAVLPFFEQLALYRSMKLDRAWDDPENSRIQIIVPAGINDQSLPVAHTTIRAPVFPGSLWHGDGPPKRMADITDKKAQTILLVDAPKDASIHWADPSPWVISEANLIKDFFGDRDAARVLLADGSVLLLKRSETDAEKLKAMLTIAEDD